MHKKIKELCKEKKISINQMEQDLGFSKGYISKLDNSIPSVTNAKKIADYLNVSINDLME